MSKVERYGNLYVCNSRDPDGHLEFVIRPAFAFLNREEILGLKEHLERVLSEGDHEETK